MDWRGLTCITLLAAAGCTATESHRRLVRPSLTAFEREALLAPETLPAGAGWDDLAARGDGRLSEDDMLWLIAQLGSSDAARGDYACIVLSNTNSAAAAVVIAFRALAFSDDERYLAPSLYALGRIRSPASLEMLGVIYAKLGYRRPWAAALAKQFEAEVCEGIPHTIPGEAFPRDEVHEWWMKDGRETFFGRFPCLRDLHPPAKPWQDTFLPLEETR
ncbi:MAG TPA: hypothetical protein PLP01_16940 [Phycisphaerae bacterium]|nr:hypothetical protein [Phycisphaerae bacterium]